MYLTVYPSQGTGISMTETTDCSHEATQAPYLLANVRYCGACHAEVSQ